MRAEPGIRFIAVTRPALLAANEFGRRSRVYRESGLWRLDCLLAADQVDGQTDGYCSREYPEAHNVKLNSWRLRRIDESWISGLRSLLALVEIVDEYDDSDRGNSGS